jgi:hypothetical protein
VLWRFWCIILGGFLTLLGLKGWFRGVIWLIKPVFCYFDVFLGDLEK